jgi:hypothetical protein
MELLLNILVTITLIENDGRDRFKRDHSRPVDGRAKLAVVGARPFGESFHCSQRLGWQCWPADGPREVTGCRLVDPAIPMARSIKAGVHSCPRKPARLRIARNAQSQRHRAK